MTFIHWLEIILMVLLRNRNPCRLKFRPPTQRMLKKTAPRTPRKKKSISQCLHPAWAAVAHHSQNSSGDKIPQVVIFVKSQCLSLSGLVVLAAAARAAAGSACVQAHARCKLRQVDPLAPPSPTLKVPLDEGEEMIIVPQIRLSRIYTALFLLPQTWIERQTSEKSTLQNTNEYVWPKAYIAP